MAPTKYDKAHLGHRIESARKLLTKLEASLPAGEVDKAVLIGEMHAHLEMLVEAAEPFAPSGGQS